MKAKQTIICKLCAKEIKHKTSLVQVKEDEKEKKFHSICIDCWRKYPDKTLWGMLKKSKVK